MLPLKERVYRHIRDQMLTGKIRPGQSVSETVLAKGIGVSRTPVREALVRLETLGLIEQQPGVGTRVREFDRRDIEECFEVREVLECGAARLAARYVNDAEVAELETLVGQYHAIAIQFRSAATPENFEELLNRANILDMAFHLKIIAASKNRRLVQMVGDVHLLTRILRRKANLPSESRLHRMSRVLLHHHRILEGLRARDPERACNAAEAHVRWSKEGHLTAFEWYARNKTHASQNGMFYPESVLNTLGQMEIDVLRDKTLDRAPHKK